MTVGWVTLDTGVAALVYALNGSARIEVGPKRLFLWREKIVYMPMHRANQSEYLEIVHCNGLITHKRGPCVEARNPLVHKKITKKDGIPLDANEVLCVYKGSEEGKFSATQVSRYLKYGPTIFIPAANEWLHEFRWHGVDPDNKTRQIPNGNVFTKLKVIPDQFYYNIDEVRTADDALMRVKLMMFYELQNVEQMLNATQDPIADFINCLSADVVAFASKLTYMEFIEKAEELNDMKHYPQLQESSKRIGYEISKIVFRGYHAAPKLQSMHDNAIATRTKLKIAYESEEQLQMLTDMKLKTELERLHLEQNLQLDQLQHQHKMELSEKEHHIKLSKQQEEEKIRHKKQNESSKLESKKSKDQQALDHYGKLKDLGVDMTEYLLSLNPKPEKLVKVVTHNNAANLHLHQ